MQTGGLGLPRFTMVMSFNPDWTRSNLLTLEVAELPGVLNASRTSGVWTADERINRTHWNTREKTRRIMTGLSKIPSEYQGGACREKITPLSHPELKADRGPMSDVLGFRLDWKHLLKDYTIRNQQRRSSIRISWKCFSRRLPTKEGSDGYSRKRLRRFWKD